MRICCPTAKEADITKNSNETPNTTGENKEVVKEEIENEELNEQEANEETEDTAEETVQQPDPLEEANDRYLRLAAEYDNFKRRTQKEKAQIYTDASAAVIEVILPFMDNLTRASSVEVESEDAVRLLEGIKLVERQFTDALKGLGVEEIKAVGEKFDPNLHNAVMHVDDADIEGEEIVVEEFIKGYKYKEKVIRHSTVKVAN